MTVTKEMIEAGLRACVPGGSSVDHWFMPHDSEKGAANVREVLGIAYEAMKARDTELTTTKQQLAEANKTRSEQRNWAWPQLMRIAEAIGKQDLEKADEIGDAVITELEILKTAVRVMEKALKAQKP